MMQWDYTEIHNHCTPYCSQWTTWKKQGCGFMIILVLLMMVYCFCCLLYIQYSRSVNCQGYVIFIASFTTIWPYWKKIRQCMKHAAPVQFSDILPMKVHYIQPWNTIIAITKNRLHSLSAAKRLPREPQCRVCSLDTCSYCWCACWALCPFLVL